LIGDSIFDNAVYVPGGPSVVEHLRRVLPSGWEATLLAIDGARMSSVERQLQRLPADATHLVLSVGGNDALGHSAFILSEPTDSYASALAGMAAIRDEFSMEYRQMLADVRATGLPLAVCTIYDSGPGLRPPESAGLSIFNDAITRHAIAARATLLDLRLVCNEPSDYAAVLPIEPSASGGGKIARAIHSALFNPDTGCRVVV
jgi:lysophospholipase L1-like esterase